MRKYPVLRAVSRILVVIGWIAVAVAVLSFLWGAIDLAQIMNNGLAAMSGVIKIASSFGVAVAGLVTVAIGEAFRIFIDIEANTAETARSLAASSPRTFPPSLGGPSAQRDVLDLGARSPNTTRQPQPRAPENEPSGVRPEPRSPIGQGEEAKRTREPREVRPEPDPITSYSDFVSDEIRNRLDESVAAGCIIKLEGGALVLELPGYARRHCRNEEEVLSWLNSWEVKNAVKEWKRKK